MFGIIYTPTVGEAIENYSHLFRRPVGCFLDIKNSHEIEDRLKVFGGPEDIDYIVVTDGEEILGIGDQGAGGIGISVAKLDLMTLCGGINPGRGIAVALDTGTDRQTLLRDPLYLGNRFPRVRGEEYDYFVDTFVKAVHKLFPKAMLHFEDFGLANARNILHRYRDELACFNDDIQGTGAVTLAGLTAASKVLKKDLTDFKFLIFGAGTAGTGIADQVVDNLTVRGLDEAEARSKIWLFDRPGLLVKSLGDKLTNGQLPYAIDDELADGINRTSLIDVISYLKPDVLVGCSTKPKAFTEEVVKEMAKHVERPVILPLSNPTRLLEAVPADLLKWTDGKALIATGSPFEPVHGQTIAENNNCFVFPGIGLGTVLSRSSRVTKTMIAASIEELAKLSPILNDPSAGLLPDVEGIRDISARIATAVVLQAVKDGVSTVENEFIPGTDQPIAIPLEFDDCLAWVKNQMWKPEYRPLHKVEE